MVAWCIHLFTVPWWLLFSTVSTGTWTPAGSQYPLSPLWVFIDSFVPTHCSNTRFCESWTNRNLCYYLYIYSFWSILSLPLKWWNLFTLLWRLRTCPSTKALLGTVSLIPWSACVSIPHCSPPTSPWNTWDILGHLFIQHPLLDYLIGLYSPGGNSTISLKVMWASDVMDWFVLLPHPYIEASKYYLA